VLVGGRVDEQAGEAEEALLEAVGDGEQEEDLDGVGDVGEGVVVVVVVIARGGGGCVVDGVVGKVQGGGKGLQLGVVFDVLGDPGVVAT
jgi:hypothetical protein